MTFMLRTNDGDPWPGDTVMVDGYGFGERLLEDTLWVLMVVDGQVTFSHVEEGSRSYVENLSSADKIAKWGQRAVEWFLNDGDGLADDHETELHWGEN